MRNSAPARLTGDEVKQAFDDFVAAAKRAEKAGFHGVELHGAHGYLICQFISGEVNLREDEWGGAYENRVKFLMEMIDAVRSECGKDFSLGVRCRRNASAWTLARSAAWPERS